MADGLWGYGGRAGIIPSAMDITNVMMKREEDGAKAADARAKEAARVQQLDQAAALGAWNHLNEQMKIAGLPKSVQHRLYGSSRALADRLGFQLPEVAAEEWNPGYAKYMEQATKVLNMPGPVAQKQEMLGAMWAEMANDPNAAPIIKRHEEQLKAQREGEITQLSDLVFRTLTGEASQDEITRLAHLRAIAAAPDGADDLPAVRQARQEAGVTLAEAHQRALKRRQESVMAVGRDSRVVAPGPAGAMTEIVPAEPKPPKEPKEPGSLIERIELLQSSSDPEDNRRAERLIALQERTRQSMTINMPKTPPTEFITTAQSVGLAARRLSRTVERFDPTFVGILGKIKGISTKFSDFPGIPAFAERKRFANDMIGMTNDVKKILLGATRTIPELADVARFLPDPDQNLSVAEFKGNLETFIEGFIDIMDVLPGTMEQAGLRKQDFSQERKSLSSALEKLRAIDTGDKAKAAPPAGGGLGKLTDDELLKRLRQPRGPAPKDPAPRG